VFFIQTRSSSPTWFIGEDEPTAATQAGSAHDTFWDFASLSPCTCSCGRCRIAPRRARCG
jgi:hypothetical protein